MRCCLLMTLLLFGEAAYAQASCTFNSSGGNLVDFGIYTAFQGDTDGSGTINFTCIPDLLVAPTVSYAVSIGPGQNAGAGFSPRRLSNGASTLDYNLYVDASRTIIWGDGTLGTGTSSGSCIGLCSVLVFGRLNGGQGGSAGQYSDDVVVTIDFN